MKLLLVIFASVAAALCTLVISSQFGEENMMARIVLSYSLAVFVFIMLSTALDARSSFLMIIVAFYHAGMFLFPGMLHCAQGWFPFYDARYNTEDILYVAFLIAI